MTWSDGTFSGGPDPYLQPHVFAAVEIRADRNRPDELYVAVGREILRAGTRQRHFVVKGKFDGDPVAAIECARHWAAETGFKIKDFAGVMPSELDG